MLKSSNTMEMVPIMVISKHNFKLINKNHNINNYFPYHEFIPSFAKLFPHSKNILNSLRSVEDGLKIHFAKNVFDKSKSNDYLKLNENELTFKIIS